MTTAGAAKELSKLDAFAVDVRGSQGRLSLAHSWQSGLIGAVVLAIARWKSEAPGHRLKEKLANSTANMPVRKMPSKVPAPPMDATGAPIPWILSRLRRSAPTSVPRLPLM